MKRIVVALLSALLAQALYAQACTNPPRLSVVPTANGTAHLHYESDYLGSWPSFGPPAIVASTTAIPNVRYGGFLINETVNDVPQAPLHWLCRGAVLDVDLGQISDGTYDVVIQYLSSDGKPVQPSAELGFVWGDRAVQCSSVPEILPAMTPAVANQPVTLTLRELDVLGYVVGTSVIATKVSGNDITITDAQDIAFGFPPKVIRCLQTPVTIGPLGAGGYFVHWLRSNISPPTNEVATLTLPVRATRQRAAHH